MRLLVKDGRLPPAWGQDRRLEHTRYQTAHEFFKLTNEMTGPSLTTNVNLTTHLDMPCSVVYTGHSHFPFLFTGIEEALTNVVIPAAGKGWDLARGYMSSLGEGVERVLAMYATFALRDEGRIVYASYKDLVRKGEKATPPSAFQWFHDKQHADPLLPWVRFRDDMEVGWVQGKGLVSGEP
ncbi:MAG: YcaO-like family protein, partial [Methanobacteriota archaeon]